MEQKWVRWIIDNKYGSGYDGLDGDDYAGTLSAWFVFSSLGFYPVAGSDTYQIGTPLFKKAEIKVGTHTIKVAVANGIANAKQILAELAKNPKAYDYVEVMACFGGCIGGGGQPVPVNDEIRRKRSAGLYNEDNKNVFRSADENPIIKKLYQDFFSNHKNVHSVCHTSFSKKKKEVYPTK